MEQSRKQALDKLTSLGWSKEQALGIVANLQAESNFRPGAVGDGGKAYGIAQWHPDRQAEFEKRFGKNIRGSSLDEQLEFLNYEMREGNERGAGKRLLAATSAADAASIVSRYYERPADRDGEANKRSQLAAKLAGVPYTAMPATPATVQGQHAALPVETVKAGGEGWPMLPQKAPRVEMPQAPDLTATNVMAGQLAGLAGGQSAFRGAVDRLERDITQEEAIRQSTGVGDALVAGLADPRVYAAHGVLDWATRQDEDKYDPNYYASVQDELESDRPDAEREFLRENVVGPISRERALQSLAMRRELDKTYGYAGGLASFVGQMGAGVADPIGWAAGLGVGKVLQLGRVGSVALAAGGRMGAARASLVAEAAVGNMAVEAALDATGEVKSFSDYAMAGAVGVAMAAPMSLFLPRDAAMHPAADVNAESSIVREADDAARTSAQDVMHAVNDGQRAAVSDGTIPDEVIQQEIDGLLGPEPARRGVSAVPEDVIAEQRVELDNAMQAGLTDMEEPTPVTPAPDAQDAEPVAPTVTQAAPEQTPEQVEGYVQAAAQGEAETALGVTPEGDTVKMGWATKPRERKADETSLREALNTIKSRADLPPSMREILQLITGKGSDDVMDKVHFSLFTERGRKRGEYNPTEGAMGLSVKETKAQRKGVPVSDTLNKLPTEALRVFVHETIHAFTHSKIEAHLRGKSEGLAKAAAEELEEVMGAFVEATRNSVNWEVKYAKTNLHEFLAQLVSEPDVQAALHAMPATRDTSNMGLPRTLWGQAVRAISSMLGVKPKNTTALAQTMRVLDSLLSARDVAYVDANNVPLVYSQASPAQLAEAGRKRSQKIVRHAVQFMRDNPIDPSKLKVLNNLVKKFGGVSDGVVLAGSRNPIMQLVASLVTEVTTGAAGRKATVAIRAEMLRNGFVGNGLVDFARARDAWYSSHKVSMKDRVLTRDGANKFDMAVYTEMRARRDPAYKSDGADANVVRAADALEAGFQRSADAQKKAGVLGADAIHETSRGYVPQSLDGAKLQAVMEDFKAFEELVNEVARQFREDLNMTPQFAKQFARRYLERSRDRAMGDKGLDGLTVMGEGHAVVRDAINDVLQGTPDMRDQARAAMATIGQGHTKKRLQLDLTAPFNGGTLADIYNTDVTALYRRYMHSSAGNTALTEQGILGVHGMRELRAAALTGVDGVPPATLQEFDAFDRVFGEVLGTQVAGEMKSQGATTLGLVVGLQRLGGLVWTQINESWAMLHHVGLRQTLSGVASLPRMIREVRQSYRTGSAPQGLLSSIEVYSGSDVGMNGYKTVMPFDAPNNIADKYLEEPSLLQRALRAGGHYQSVITGFRALIAAQHRMAAEQITLRAMRFIRDGKDSKALADMGFTPEVANHIRAFMTDVAQWDQQGNLKSLDVTKIPDPMVREAFVQSVHRGTAQIIQGTFIGERSKWMHNDYLRLMLQLRTFGLTSIEKQWSRTSMNQGLQVALPMLMVQVGMAVPLHLARVQLNSVGREDRKKFLKDNTSPAALIRAAMNYASLAGLTGDVLELASGFAGWGDSKAQEMVGARQQTASIGRAIPIAGSVDTLLRVATGRSDLYTGIKQLPYSSVWWLNPGLNLFKEK